MDILDKIEKKHCNHICNGGKPRYLIIGIEKYKQLFDDLRNCPFVFTPINNKAENYSEYNAMEILISYRDKNIIKIK